MSFTVVDLILWRLLVTDIRLWLDPLAVDDESFLELFLEGIEFVNNGQSSPFLSVLEL